MTVTANDLYGLGLAVGALLRGHVDPARKDRVLALIRTLEAQAGGETERRAAAGDDQAQDALHEQDVEYRRQRWETTATPEGWEEW